MSTSDFSSKLLFGDKYAPITSSIGFLETDFRKAAEAFIKWSGPIQRSRSVSLDARTVSGRLGDLLKLLLPLTTRETRRFLFTSTKSPWTAYFDNSVGGTDVVSVIPQLARGIGCRGLRVTAVPNSINPRKRQGRYGALIFELYGPSPTRFLNYVRSVGLVNDGGKWQFYTSGDPLPFENMDHYTKRNVLERFTVDNLIDYLKVIGLNPFSEEFYLSNEDNNAILIQKIGPHAKGLEEFSLEEARAKF